MTEQEHQTLDQAERDRIDLSDAVDGFVLALQAYLQAAPDVRAGQNQALHEGMMWLMIQLLAAISRDRDESVANLSRQMAQVHRDLARLAQIERELRGVQHQLAHVVHERGGPTP